MIRIYALRTAYITGVPHVDQDVEPERADELTAYAGGHCFTTDPDHPDRIAPEPVEAPKGRKVRASSPPAVEAANPDGSGQKPAPATEG
jgi:hypothetical protein